MKEFKDINGNELIDGKWYCGINGIEFTKFKKLNSEGSNIHFYEYITNGRHDNGGSGRHGSFYGFFDKMYPANYDDYSKYLPKGHLDLKPKELKDNLKVGTWYFHGILDNNKPSYLGKFLRIDDQNQFQASEYTFSSGSSYHTDFIKNRWTTCLWKDNLREATQEELNSILPEGHPDRSDNIPEAKFKVGDIVDLNSAYLLSNGGTSESYPLQGVFDLKCLARSKKAKIRKVFYNKEHQRYWYDTDYCSNHVLEGPEITLHGEVVASGTLPELTEDNIRDYHGYEIEFEYLTKYTGKLSIEQGRIFLLENENGHNNGHKLFRDEYKYSVVLDISNSNIKQHKIKLIKFDKFIPSYYTPTPELYSAIKDEEIRLHKVPNSNIQIRTINIPTVEIQRVDLKQQNQLRIQIPEVKPQSIQRVIINNKHLKLN